MSVTIDGAATNGKPHVGRALRRKEDPRLITGRASYVDDINLTFSPRARSSTWVTLMGNTPV
jgi:hypothetical protein